MRKLQLALILCCICAAAAGCAKPAYWIPGLSLPAGSTVVNQAETGNFQGMMPGMPMLGTPDKVLTVSFNNSSDWASVSAHIDGCMSRAGYTESMGALAGMAGAAGQSSYPGGVNPLDMTRMYTKQGEKFTVMLMNYKDILAASGAQGSAQSLPGMGDYQLAVMRMK